jgi:hypothetical protein
VLGWTGRNDRMGPGPREHPTTQFLFEGLVHGLYKPFKAIPNPNVGHAKQQKNKIKFGQDDRWVLKKLQT